MRHAGRRRRRGALPETCGDAALLVDPADGDQFAQALVAAATDEQLRSRLIAAGASRAQTFTWGQTAELTDARSANCSCSRAS